MPVEPQITNYVDEIGKQPARSGKVDPLRIHFPNTTLPEDTGLGVKPPPTSLPSLGVEKPVPLNPPSLGNPINPPDIYVPPPNLELPEGYSKPPPPPFIPGGTGIPNAGVAPSSNVIQNLKLALRNKTDRMRGLNRRLR